MKRYAIEFIGTFALVFAGTGAIVIDGATGGGVLRAHLNPAVTLRLFAARRFEGRWRWMRS